MINPYKFVWDDISSLEFDVLTDLAFDSDSGTIETHLSREAVVSETYNGALKRVHGYKWSDNFTFQLTLIKNNFGDFTSEENRKILKWLTGRQNAGFINIYKDDSEVVEFAALGNFINVSQYKLGNGRIVGYVAEWESLMPHALSDLYTITKTVTDPSNNKIIIDVETDDNNPIYPRVTIKHNNNSVVSVLADPPLTHLSDMVENTTYLQGGTYYWKTAPSTDPIYFYSSPTDPKLTTTSVRLTNIHTDLFNQITVLKPTIVKNNNLGEVITLDGANQIVASNSVNRVFDTDFVDWRWLALYDGKNEITVEGNCTVTIEFREVRKVGEYV